VPAIPSWLLEPLWDQFAALLLGRPVYHPSHPLGCHKPRIADRIIFEKLIQVLRFGCSYVSIADCACGATTIRDRRDEWIRAGIFAEPKTIARESYDRMAGLALRDIAAGGVHHQGARRRGMRGPEPGRPPQAGHEALQHGRGKGIPPGRVLAPANRHDSPLLAPTLDKLDDIGPLPDDITVHLDAGYELAVCRGVPVAGAAVLGDRPRALL
jgi:transposase